jgi:hypothetical protein
MINSNSELKPEEKTDVVNRSSTEVAAPRSSVKKGLEEPNQADDIIIPQAKLMQSNSPQLEDDDSLRPGMIINNLTGEVLPEDFIPIFKFTNWIRFNSRDKNDPNYDAAFKPGALIWKSSDPNDPRVISESKWGENGEKPAATKMMNFFAYFPGVHMPVIVTFCNTSWNAGKKLNSLCQFGGGDAIFERTYKLTSKDQENDQGKFKIFQVALQGEATPEDYKVADDWYNKYQPMMSQIKVHDEENVIDDSEYEEKAPY